MKNKFICLFLFILILLQSVFSIMQLSTAQRMIILTIEIIGLMTLFFNLVSLVNRRISCYIILYIWYVLFNSFIASNHLFNLAYTITDVLWWPSIFILFYIACHKRCFKWESMLVIFLINSLLYFNEISGRIIAFENLRTNTIFYIITLTPFIMLIKKLAIREFLLFFIIICSIISGKRSAMIAMGIILLIELYRVYRCSYHKTAIIIVTCASFIGLATVVYSIESTLGISFIERFQGIQDDGGSGRIDAYSQVLQQYSELPLLSKFVGRGHNAVRVENFVRLEYSNDETLSAHNDFLEILYDYGIIGLLLYLIFIIQIIKLITKMKCHSPHYYTTLYSIIIWGVMSLFSHLILYPTYFAYLIIFWTYIYSQREKQISTYNSI